MNEAIRLFVLPSCCLLADKPVPCLFGLLRSGRSLFDKEGIEYHQRLNSNIIFQRIQNLFTVF